MEGTSRVLSIEEERAILKKFWEAKCALATRLAARCGITVKSNTRTLPLELAKVIASTWRYRWRDRLTQSLIADYHGIKHQLAQANIRLAAHLAKRFRSYGVPYADLLNEAVCGLLHAIDRFDHNFETRLATYATWWIRQALQIAVAQQSHLVSLSPHHLQQLGKWQREVEALAHSDQEIPTKEKVQHRCGLEATAQLSRLQAVARQPVSIDASLDESSEFSLSHIVTQQDAFAERERLEQRELITHLLGNLNPRERTVVSLRHGLTGDALSLRDIGRLLKISKERVRQIQNGAMAKLRQAISQEGIEDVMLTH